ncbi:hypothetical protein Bca4012_034846 [Brassica carinata]
MGRSLLSVLDYLRFRLGRKPTEVDIGVWGYNCLRLVCAGPDYHFSPVRVSAFFSKDFYVCVIQLRELAMMKMGVVIDASFFGDYTVGFCCVLENGRFCVL